MFQPHLSEQPLILVVQSEIMKFVVQKMEALGKVHDDSIMSFHPGTGPRYMIAVTQKTKHSLSLYSQLYSSVKPETNEETYKGFRYVDQLLGEKTSDLCHGLRL